MCRQAIVVGVDTRRSEDCASAEVCRQNIAANAKVRSQAEGIGVVIRRLDTEKVQIPAFFLLVKLWTSQKICFS